MIVGARGDTFQVVGIVGVISLEQNDEWAARYTTLETSAPLADDHAFSMPLVARWSYRPLPVNSAIRRLQHHGSEYDPFLLDAILRATTEAARER